MSEQAPAKWIVLSVDDTLSDYSARLDAYARKLADEMSEMLPGGMRLEWGISASVVDPSQSPDLPWPCYGHDQVVPGRLSPAGMRPDSLSPRDDAPTSTHLVNGDASRG